MRIPKSHGRPLFQRKFLPLLFSLSLAGGMVGCAAAAVGAGAAAGIAYTDRGAKGDVKGNVTDVNQQARKALRGMGIQIVGYQTKEAGNERGLNGKKDSTDISVNMTQGVANTTHVEVIARESTLKWNKDYAKQILAKIISEG